MESRQHQHQQQNLNKIPQINSKKRLSKVIVFIDFVLFSSRFGQNLSFHTHFDNFKMK